MTDPVSDPLQQAGAVLNVEAERLEVDAEDVFLLALLFVGVCGRSAETSDRDETTAVVDERRRVSALRSRAVLLPRELSTGSVEKKDTGSSKSAMGKGGSSKGKGGSSKGKGGSSKGKGGSSKGKGKGGSSKGTFLSRALFYSVFRKQAD